MAQSSNVAASNRMLPLIRRIVRDARAKHRMIGRKLATVGGAIDIRKRDAIVAKLREEYGRNMAELRELRCDLLDANTGLVGRRADIDGKLVTITWRPGQRAFSEWFADGEAPTDRKPLSVSPVASAV